jgi:hypothetical protein
LNLVNRVEQGAIGQVAKAQQVEAGDPLVPHSSDVDWRNLCHPKGEKKECRTQL